MDILKPQTCTLVISLQVYARGMSYVHEFSDMRINVDFNAKGPYGQTALHDACEKGRLDIATLILGR